MDLKNHIQQNRAALFDWTVILTSFLLGFVFPTISEFIASPAFHGMMLAVLLVYTAGAALKHLPLSYRLTHAAKTIRPIPYTIFLAAGHWFIFFIVAIFAEPAFRSIVGLPAATKENTLSGWSLVISSLLAIFITWLVYRSKTKHQREKEYKPALYFRQEVVADILLTASVAVLSFFFWEKGVMAMLDRAKTENFGDIWFLFFFLCILFVFFYLPLRYLFFIEDREGGRNRRRLLLIFAFMLIRAIFRMIGI
jgi:hypothetical protein